MEASDAVVDWEQETNETSIKGLKALHEKLILIRESKEALETELAELEVDKKVIEANILTIMKEENLPSFKSEHGTLSIKNNKSVAQPETLEDKLAFFDYLKEQGIFHEMVSVNSRTLSSWAGKEIEAKEQKGVFGWVPPGLKAVNEYQSLSVRKK